MNHQQLQSELHHHQFEFIALGICNTLWPFTAKCDGDWTLGYPISILKLEPRWVGGQMVFASELLTGGV